MMLKIYVFRHNNHTTSPLPLRARSPFVGKRDRERGTSFFPGTSIMNHCNNTINIGENFVVPEPKNAEPLPFQPIVANSIFLDVDSVLATIHFDNNPLFKTDEVDNILPDDLLALEFKPGKPLCPEVSPQLSFCFSGVFSQYSRKFDISAVHFPLSPTLSREGRGSFI